MMQRELLTTHQESQIKSTYQIQFSQEMGPYRIFVIKLPSSSFVRIYFHFAQIIAWTYSQAKGGKTVSSKSQKERETFCNRGLLYFFTLKLNNFGVALIIIKYQSSMTKNSSTSHNYTEQHQNQSDSQENSSSNFSFAKTKKSERKTHKKKITKIVHTVCFFKTTQEGRKQIVYHQQIGETTLRSKDSINKLVNRRSRSHSFKMIELAKKKAAIQKNASNEAQVKMEEKFPMPYAYCFPPEQFYYIC